MINSDSHKINLPTDQYKPAAVVLQSAVVRIRFPIVSTDGRVVCRTHDGTDFFNRHEHLEESPRPLPVGTRALVSNCQRLLLSENR